MSQEEDGREEDGQEAEDVLFGASLSVPPV